ncbi:unnamed protein product [Sphenostylis stenocarpa]|uniref:Uncharacterized protein n=1 Tax=Sphenostylis stenocarpa TaxID=92480 RepID=A0AA86VMW3_9FABA|nr:unnamed protein product [Sphenostylis stenocarpa]
MRGRTRLFVLLLLSFFLCVSRSSAQLPPDVVVSARLLDVHLQDLAFKTLFSPRTGVSYDAQVPTNLTGIKVSTMRLRSGSLRTRGVLNYKEFMIPIGVIENPYVERLVLVYQNLGNWSDTFYPLPGYSYLTPVLGLLAYSGANLSASVLPELAIRASDKPVLVNFPNVKLLGAVAKCVYFDLHGSVKFDNLLPGNVCSTMQQGHFSIVAESNAPSPAPCSRGEVQFGGKNKIKKRKKTMLWMGGILLLVIIMGVLVVGVRRHRKRRVQELECVADGKSLLDMTSIGDIKVPFAFGTRTRPTIEHGYFA